MAKSQVCFVSLLLGAGALYLVQKSTGKLVPK
jgi:hypothetical protein